MHPGSAHIPDSAARPAPGGDRPLAASGTISRSAPAASTARLAAREKFAYGFGDLASVLYWQTFMVYLTYFYTDVFGIAAAATGAMLGLSRSIDAFTDPMVGILADRTRTRWGKFRPYLLWFCVPFATMGVLTFTVPDLAASGRLVWAWLTYNGLMLLYTAINIPYTAMLGVLTPDPNERTSLSSIKFVFAFAAGILVSATLLPMTRVLGGGDAARGWQLSFVVIGVAAVAFFLVTFFNTRERVQPPAAQRTSLLRDLGDLLTNGPWLVLLAATITLILFIAVRSSVTVHYFKYYVGPQTVTLPGWIPQLGGTQQWNLEGMVSAFNTTGQVASLTGVLLVPFLARRSGRKLAFVLLFLVAIAATAGFHLLRPDQFIAMCALNMLGALAEGPLSPLLWAMYADTADYSEWKTGRRATGLVFSASTFSQKQGWALAAWIALSLMQHMGFVANAEQPPESLRALVLLMSVIPAAIGVVSLLILLAYPLHESRVAAIGADLQARRSAATTRGTGIPA